MRSSWSFTRLRSRGSIILYQTAESYWSVKHSACSIARCTTARSSGSLLRIGARDAARQSSAGRSSEARG